MNQLDTCHSCNSHRCRTIPWLAAKHPVRINTSIPSCHNRHSCSYRFECRSTCCCLSRTSGCLDTLAGRACMSHPCNFHHSCTVVLVSDQESYGAPYRRCLENIPACRSYRSCSCRSGRRYTCRCTSFGRLDTLVDQACIGRLYSSRRPCTVC